MKLWILAVLICVGLVAQAQAQQMITVDYSTGQLYHLYSLNGESRTNTYQIVLPKAHVQREMNLKRPVLGTFTQADYKPAWWPTENMRRKNPALPREVRYGQRGHPIGIYRLRIAWHNPSDPDFWAPVRIHGGAKTADLNEAESAGCVRMLDPDIVQMVNNISAAQQQGESVVHVSFGFFSG